MIRTEEGIQVKYLDGGVMYIWFYTERSWVPFYLNPMCKDGCIKICFKDMDECELIKLSPEFDSHNYQILTHQEKDQITLVCIPKLKIENAVPFKIKENNATGEVANA